MDPDSSRAAPADASRPLRPVSTAGSEARGTADAPDAVQALRTSHEMALARISEDCGAACADVARSQLGVLALLARTGVPARWLLRMGTDRTMARRALAELTSHRICALSEDGDRVGIEELRGQVLRLDMDSRTARRAEDDAARILGGVRLDRVRDPQAWRCEVLDLVEQMRAISAQAYSRWILSREEVAGSLAQVARLAPSPVTLTLEEPVTALAVLLGPDHAHTLTARNSLAAAYRETGDPDKAASMFEQVLHGTLNLVGPDHPLSLTARNNLAGACRETGETVRAVELYEQVIDDAARLLGPNHPDTLSARNNLALAHEAAGDLAQAADHLERLVEDAQRELSAQHPYLTPFRRNLERVRGEQETGSARPPG